MGIDSSCGRNKLEIHCSDFLKNTIIHGIYECKTPSLLGAEDRHCLREGRPVEIMYSQEQCPDGEKILIFRRRRS